MKVYFVGIFLITTLTVFVFAPVALAQNDSLIDGQDPSVTLGQIFDPIKRFFNWGADLIENIILHLFDWDWIRGIFIGLFETIDGWIEKVTGNNLAGVFRVIGNTLVEAFNFVVDLIKDLWPF